MGEEGKAGFDQVDSCEHFRVITADPAAPSPIPETKTLWTLMHGQPPVFDTVQTMPDDACVILYTSGTTGQPKGAELSHANIFMNSLVIRDLFHARPDDIQLVVLPLFHSFGQTVQLNAGFLCGNTLVLIPRFDPDAVLNALQNERVTIFCGVPTMYWALLNHPETTKFDLAKIAATLRLSVSGGASLPVEILHTFEKKFEVKILEGYGLSETSPVATFNRLDRERKPGSIGIPIWGVDVKVVDEKDNEVPVGEVGEIIIRGHNIMKGYYKKAEATAETIRNDWFHSGDLARKDEDGYIYIVDRVKDMIIRGGFNVYPREVEDVLMAHPAISLAAVLGVPDEKSGEEIKAFVVLKEGATATPEEIIAWTKKEMAAYKYPRIVEIRESLPMTATGKILKKELRGE
ncbi:MAG: long-chain fatty acid--CoA ligase, partial [bacterium]